VTFLIWGPPIYSVVGEAIVYAVQIWHTDYWRIPAPRAHAW